MKIITITNEDGTQEQVKLIRQLDIKELNRTFAIYTKGEKYNSDISKVYVSEVVEASPGEYNLEGIGDALVWDKVKQAMKDIIQSDQ